jgi:hypothetical protein
VPNSSGPSLALLPLRLILSGGGGGGGASSSLVGLSSPASMVLPPTDRMPKEEGFLWMLRRTTGEERGGSTILAFSDMSGKKTFILLFVLKINFFCTQNCDCLMNSIF